MTPTSSGPLPTVEHIDDVLALAYSTLVVTDRQVGADEQADTFDQQFFVDWEVPEEN